MIRAQAKDVGATMASTEFRRQRASWMGIMLDIQARFFRLWRSIPEDSHRLAWEGATMENVLVAAVALFLGFNLGVLVVRCRDLSDAGEMPGRIQAQAHPVSAWWR